MPRISLQGIAAGCLAVTLAVLAHAGGEGKDTAQSFKLTLASKIDTVIMGEKQTIDADTELHYTWKRNGNERVLSFDLMGTRVNVAGKQTLNITMTRDKLINSVEDKEIPVNQAPQPLQAMLLDSFGMAICKLQVDATGKEVKRTMVAGPGAKELIHNGMIANALLFHPPFLRDQDRWQAEKEVSMGNGSYARGKFTYEKVVGASEGRYRVSGTLSNVDFKPSGPLMMKDVRYLVRGEQTYDQAKEEWVAGKMSIDVSFHLTKGDEDFGSARGTIVVEFANVPAKK